MAEASYVYRKRRMEESRRMFFKIIVKMKIHNKTVRL
jgi:hypothetical protein